MNRSTKVKALFLILITFTLSLIVAPLPLARQGRVGAAGAGADVASWPGCRNRPRRMSRKAYAATATPSPNQGGGMTSSRTGPAASRRQRLPARSSGALRRRPQTQSFSDRANWASMWTSCPCALRWRSVWASRGQPIRLVGDLENPRVLGVADPALDVTGPLRDYAESQVGEPESSQRFRTQEGFTQLRHGAGQGLRPWRQKRRAKGHRRLRPGADAALAAAAGGGGRPPDRSGAAGKLHQPNLCLPALAAISGQRPVGRTA